MTGGTRPRAYTVCICLLQACCDHLTGSMNISGVRVAVAWAPLLCMLSVYAGPCFGCRGCRCHYTVAEAVDATTRESVACAMPRSQCRPYSAYELMIQSLLTLAAATCAACAAAVVQAKGELPLALPAAPHLVAADGSVKIPPKW
jgi:hypothetical protein